MADPLIHRLRAMEKAATPGKWKAASLGVPSEREMAFKSLQVARTHAQEVVVTAADVGGNRPWADAKLIAAMRNHLVALLDVAEAAEKLEDAETDEDGITATVALMQSVRALRALEQHHE